MACAHVWPSIPRFRQLSAWFIKAITCAAIGSSADCAGGGVGGAAASPGADCGAAADAAGEGAAPSGALPSCASRWHPCTDQMLRGSHRRDCGDLAPAAQPGVLDLNAVIMPARAFSIGAVWPLTFTAMRSR